MKKQSIFVEYILLLKKRLSFAGVHWQMNTTLFQIDQKKCKIEQICIWNQRTVSDF